MKKIFYCLCCASMLNLYKYTPDLSGCQKTKELTDRIEFDGSKKSSKYK